MELLLAPPPWATHLLSDLGDWVTRWVLSAIWREVATSSPIVVVISLIAVENSFAPDDCCVAAAWSSDDELWMCCTAAVIWRVSVRVR